MSILRAIYFAAIAKNAYDNAKSSGQSTKDMAKNAALGCVVAAMALIGLFLIGLGIIGYFVYYLVNPH